MTNVIREVEALSAECAGFDSRSGGIPWTRKILA